MSKVDSLKKFLLNPDIDKIYNYFNYGPVKNKVTLLDLRESNFETLDSPVFFLSTGRCGTSWFTELLETDDALKVFHVPIPEMAAQGRIAYEYHIKGNITARESKLLQEIFLTGREEYLLKCQQSGKKFIETDPRLTFFAHHIAAVLPNSKFVHLYRHPADVVRSGFRRDWYNSRAGHELSKISPENSNIDWQNYSRVQKIAWLWGETNQYISDFQNTIAEDRFFTFNFDEKSKDNVKLLLSFIGSNIKESIILDFLNKKVNVNTVRTKFPKYDEWSLEDKADFKLIVNEVAVQLGYKL